MSNRFLGEATTTVDGVTYTLRCDFNAMLAFEDKTGKDAMETFENFETGEVPVRDMRAIMWSFLQHHHPDADLKLAGEVLSADIDAMMRVIEAASPTAEEVKELGNGARKAARKKKSPA